MKQGKTKLFGTKQCRDFKDFLSEIDNKINKGWIFRGQQLASWLLQHRFERACNRFCSPQEKRAQIETNMIREFRRRLHHYTANLPSKDAYDEWMSLMQHHGTCTRFLDFTYSPYVAAYFAFEFAVPDSTAAIWAINTAWFTEALKELKNIPNNEKIYKKYKTYLEDREKFPIFNEVFIREKDPWKLVLTVNPFRLNERLAFQRGAFLCPGDVSISFMDNLAVYTDNLELPEQILRYTIPTGQNNENTISALENLDSMNINRITLFPGLDGFAQSLETRIKSLFEMQSGLRY